MAKKRLKRTAVKRYGGNPKDWRWLPEEGLARFWPMAILGGGSCVVKEVVRPAYIKRRW